MEISAEDATRILNGWVEESAFLEATLYSPADRGNSVVYGYLQSAVGNEMLLCRTPDVDRHSHMIFSLGGILKYELQTADWAAREFGSIEAENLFHGDTLLRFVYDDGARLTLGRLDPARAQP